MLLLHASIPMGVFLVHLLLAVVALRSSRRNPVRRLLAVLLAVLALWALAVFGIRASGSPDVAYVWQRWSDGLLAFASVLVLHFAFRLAGARVSGGTLALLYGAAGIAALLSLAGMVVTRVDAAFHGYVPRFGVGAVFAVAVISLPQLMALIELLRARRTTTSPPLVTRLDYAFLGTSLLLLGGVTDLLSAIGVLVYPSGTIGALAFGVIVTVAVTGYHLMEIRILLGRACAHFVVSAIILGFYGVIFLALSLLLRQQTTTASLLATVAAVVVASFTMPAVVSWAYRRVDRLFFRQRYDHLVALQRFVQDTQHIRDFSRLAGALTRTACLAMQATWAVLLAPDPESGQFRAAARATLHGRLADRDTPMELGAADESRLAQGIGRAGRPVRVEELEFDPRQLLCMAERRRIERAGAQVLVPIISDEGLTAVLVLGRRVADTRWSQTDLDLLMTVSSQAATMIDNARHFSLERRRREELERLDTLKSTLLHTVAHEIKSPLTAVRGSVDLLLSEGNDLPPWAWARLTQALKHGVQRLEQLVADSLDYAQAQSGQLTLNPQSADLGNLVEQVASSVAPALSIKGQEIHLDVPPPLPPALVDSSRIERVLLNLLTNANKYTQAGGAIRVRVYRDGAMLAVEVGDNGPGIPESDQELIFNEYYRGPSADRRRHPGSGLGLPLTRQLVERHGGSIRVASRPDEGSTFTFTVPVAAEPPDAGPRTL